MTTRTVFYVSWILAVVQMKLRMLT